MSLLLTEIRNEIQARINSAKSELEILKKSKSRIAELESFISEAEKELESVCARIPEPEKTE